MPYPTQRRSRPASAGRLVCAAGTALAALAVPSVLFARTGTWNSALDASYSTGNNWLFSGVPGNPAAGDVLTIGAGLGAANYQASSATGNLMLSTTSGDGQSLTVNGKLKTIWVPGGQSSGSGLVLGNGGYLSINGTANASGQAILAGELAVGFNTGSSATANFSGSGLISVDTAVNPGTDPTLYAGLNGSGIINQSGTFSASTYDLAIAAGSSSTGIYNLTGGTISAGDTIAVGGTYNSIGGAGVLNVAGGSVQSPALKVWNSSGSALNISAGVVNTGALTLAGALNLTGGTLQASSIATTSTGQWNWSGGTLNISGGITIGPGGLTTNRYTIQQLGLTDAVHTQTGGLTYNNPDFDNPAGQIVGDSKRFGGTTDEGQDVWIYSPSINATRQIGLTDAAHTQTGGYAYNYAVGVGDAGQVAGQAYKYSGSNLQGFDAWYYSLTTNATQIIGLTDSAHVQTGGYSQNTPVAISSNGQVAGAAERYTGSTDQGSDAWIFNPAANTTTLIGLTDAAHVETGGYAYNYPTAVNPAGQVIGTAERYSGSTDNGTDAWEYSLSSNTTRLIGLSDSSHVQTGGYASNIPIAINSAGQVIGTSERYSGSTDQGTDAWFYSPVANTTVAIGLTDAAHTQTGGYSLNQPAAINSNGQAVGTAERYSGSTDLGTDTWFYSAANNSSRVIGLTDSAHTQTGGYSNNTPFAINTAGQVIGSADRFSGSTQEGYDAWFYSPSTNTTSVIGLTDSAHVQTGGYAYNGVTAINAAGQVIGQAERYSGSTDEGSDGWLFDPAKNMTYPLSFSNSSSGTALTSVQYLNDAGVAVGYYYLYSGTSYTQDAFVWTEAGGFADLGTVIAGGLTSSGWANLASAISVDNAGRVMGIGTISGGSGQQVFLLTPAATIPITAGMKLNVTGTTTVASASTLQLSGGTVTTAAVVVSSGGTFVWTAGTLNVTGTGSSFGTTLTVPGGGILKLDGGITDPLAISAGGVANFDASTGTGILNRSLNGITLAANGSGGSTAQLNLLSASNHANRQLVTTTSLTLAGTTNAWQGLVDLSNNDLDVQNGNLANITNQIKQGFNGGPWNGTGGIISSAAAGNPTHLTALGVILNGTTYGTGVGSSGLFDGINPAATDVLVKYTYYGDANLDGQVDGSDYTKIDNGYNNHLTGWANGDFNYDGVIDGSDYTLIDNAFNTQGVNLSTAAQVAVVSSEPAATPGAVPEPTAGGLLGMAVITGLYRRRGLRGGSPGALP